MLHRETHRTGRTGWLRADVLGANDGVVSTPSLVIAAAQTTGPEVLLAGVAGAVAGAMPMAAGEYVSVSSQADTERAAPALERGELAADPAGELLELTRIYEQRGLDLSLARQVAKQLTAHDALATHARDELDIVDSGPARPVQAALASGASFAVGAAMPLLAAVASPDRALVLHAAGTSLVFLAILGARAALTGGAGVARGALRVTLWGALAMALTAGAGALVGAIS